jgi:hypothetical protein
MKEVIKSYNPEMFYTIGHRPHRPCPLNWASVNSYS